MSQFRHLIESLAGVQPVMAVFWLGLVISTTCLAVLMYTRWGQYRPLRKCMGLSLLAHMVLASYAATIHIATPMRPEADPIRISIGDGPVENAPGGGASPTANANGQPWEVFPDDVASPPKPAQFERREPGPLVEPKRLVRAEDARLPGDPSLAHLAFTEVKPLMPIAPAAKPGKGIVAGQARRVDRRAGGPTS